MALVKSTVKRATQASGDDFLVLGDGSSRLAQAVGLVDEDGNHAGIDANPVVTGPGVGTIYSPSGAGSDAEQLAIGAAVLHGFRVISASPSDRWAMVFDAAAAVSNGTAPLWAAYVPASGQASESLERGLAVTAGLRIEISSTRGTLTKTTDGLYDVYGVTS